MSATHHVEISCPTCGRPNNAVTAAGPHQQPPADGDVSICWACSCLAIFVGTPATSLRQPTDEEWTNLREDPQLAAMQTARPEARSPQDALRRAGLLR